MNEADKFPFIIKVCGITTVEDGQMAVAAGATALGFNFYQLSPRYLPPQQASRLIQQISGGYLRVGVFVNASKDELEKVGSMAQLDVLQLHGALPEELPPGFRMWRATSADASPILNSAFEAFLLDTPCSDFGGSGVTFDWSLAAKFPSRSILAGGLHHGNVGEAISIARPAGVDACSKLEAYPGRKDATLVKAFVRSATEAHRRAAATNTRSEMIVNV